MADRNVLQRETFDFFQNSSTFQTPHFLTFTKFLFLYLQNKHMYSCVPYQCMYKYSYYDMLHVS